MTKKRSAKNQALFDADMTMIRETIELTKKHCTDEFQDNLLCVAVGAVLCRALERVMTKDQVTKVFTMVANIRNTKT